MSANSHPTPPFLQLLQQTTQRLLNYVQPKLPVWSGPALIALVAGFAGALLWMHSTRRNWRAQQLRTEKAIPLLKSICVSCWKEQDPEENGWLEPFEARICLARILDTLQAPNNLNPLTTIIAASQLDGSTGTSSDSNSSAASSSSTTALLTPQQTELESDLRSILQKLFVDLSQRASLEAEFSTFLERLEARPAQPPHSFTPPVGQRKTSTNSNQEAKGLTAAAVNGTSIASTATAASSSSHHSQNGDEIKSSGSSSSSLHPHHTSYPRASPLTVAALDRKIFRYEFTTAATTWLEAQIIRRVFTTEQNGSSGQRE